MKQLSNFKSFWSVVALILALPGLTLYAQDDEGGDAGGGDAAAGGDAGGGSAAEAAVTSGGVSQPGEAASGTTESNPVVTLVRAGVSWESAKVVKIAEIVTIANAGGTIEKFVETAAKIQAKVLVVTDLVTLIDAGVAIDDATSTAEGVTAGTYDLTDITTLLGKGFTAAEATSAAGGIKTGTTTLETVTGLADAGLSASDIETATAAGASELNTALLLSTRSLTTNDELYAATTQVINAATTEFSGFQIALEGAVFVADAILTDVTITTENDLPTEINAASLSQSGYTTELIRLLAKYGAIGAKGDDVANAVLGSEYTAFSSSQTLSSLLQSTTAGYLSNLADLGARTFAEEDSGSSVLSVPMSNITIGPAANVTFASGASVDVSEMLSKATSTADRKVGIIGAAKDLTFAGDTTFTNTNEVEDHALAIGAADDVYFRSEYSSANSADYDDPQTMTVRYTGSNLGIGSYDTMRLVNVNLETGGNLALGTLDELHIGLSDNHSSTFSVGTGGKNSDPDNVYLYANNLIQINGLQFSGRLDDVYMESVTINLKNVAFPSTADVMLRSRDGTVNFGTYASPVLGSVNLTEVSHGGTTLNESNVNGAAGHVNSTFNLHNGIPAIKIRGQN